MKSSPQKIEASNGLDEIIENRLQALLNKLSRPHTLNDIEADLIALNDLIYSFKRRDELLEKLLDNTTTEEKRRQIHETLLANRIKVVENELEQTHAKSHQLLERSMLLIMKAQWQIQKEAHKSSGYKLETCSNCEGAGHDAETRCPACKGAGTVLTQQQKTTRSAD